jgi:hypothetical protein
MYKPGATATVGVAGTRVMVGATSGVAVAPVLGRVPATVGAGKVGLGTVVGASVGVSVGGIGVGKTSVGKPTVGKGGWVGAAAGGVAHATVVMSKSKTNRIRIFPPRKGRPNFQFDLRVAHYTTRVQTGSTAGARD